MFTDELSRATEMLKDQPEIGRPFPRPEALGLRVLVLRRTRYLVYYVHNVDAGEVLVVAVWSGLRGDGPPIKIP
jgi:plasmid stabilization system protein ParE